MFVCLPEEDKADYANQKVELNQSSTDKLENICPTGKF